MAAAEQSGPDPDLYQLLGVSRQASREEIAPAWRRKTRTAHPDARPADAAAPGRLCDLAEAWQVLGDPARRAAYDRALDRERQPASRVPAARIRVPGRRGAAPAGMARLARVREPRLRAGPVRVEGPRQAPRAGGWDEE